MIAILTALALAAQEPALRPELEPLGFLVGHCWRGTLPTGETDTHCFEPAHGGQHVRDRHRVTGGTGHYSGETFYSADGAGGVAFTYFNSQGGVSRGTMRPASGRLDFGDERYRGPDGREITLSVSWRRAGADAYEAVTASADAPRMSGTVRYERVADAIAIDERRAVDGSLMLVHETVVAAPAEAVWRAVATAEGWREWAVPVAWTPEPDLIETSYDPSAEPGGPQTIRQRVLARVPGRMIAFRTVKAPEGSPISRFSGGRPASSSSSPRGRGGRGCALSAPAIPTIRPAAR